MTRILIVEDHHKLRDAMSRGLELDGYEVEVADTIAGAYRVIQSTSLDAIVLDLQLPDGDGLKFLAQLREQGTVTPIIVVTARGAVEQRVEGLKRGADDYLTKPFHLAELSARIGAIQRRSSSRPEAAYALDDLEVNLLDRRAKRGTRDLDLTARQFDVLAYLIRYKHRVVSREMLARDIWKSPTTTWTNVIEVLINHLRNKLEHPAEPALLHTVRGKGYVLGEQHD